MINVGSQLETSRRAVELAEKHKEGVYAAIGLHPIHVTGSLMKNKLDPEELAAQESMAEFSLEDYRKLVLDSNKNVCPEPRRRVVAIGEIGLDYYYKPKTKVKLEDFKIQQKEVLLAQMDLARELNLPIIFHCRSAHEDLIQILNTRYKIQDTKPRGVIHCFTGTWQQAQEYLNMGLYLGFNGIIFKQIQGIDWQEIISKTPLEKILVETDAPYLTPPMTDQERNEPIFVKYVVQEIAKIKKLSYQEVSEITTKNARELFKI
jgi:TatD DNase family protein